MDRTDGRPRTVRRDGTPALAPGHERAMHERDINEFTIGELFKQLSSDASLLARQEMALAKAELRETLSSVQRAMVSFVMAAVIALPAIMALTAFLVIALAGAINSWAWASLIVAVLLLAVAGLMVQRGRAALKDPSVTLPETRTSLARDASWGKQELRAFKQELTA